MSSSRQHGNYIVYARRGRRLDRISSLPDELLAHVLSFLPTRCAVTTSVLSTRWHHLFTLSTVLSFDETLCSDGARDVFRRLDAIQKRRFKKFVGKVLELHQTVPVKKFSLVYDGDYDKSDIHAWVRFAVQKGVEDLHYHVNLLKDRDLPDDIFTCKILVRLKMIGVGDYGCEIPLSTCFPRLKVLHLDDVSIEDYVSVERLFSACELLEELTLKQCHGDTRIYGLISTRLLKILRVECCSFEKGLIEIDAPNLVHLTYKYTSGIKIVPSWKDSCSLANAELYFRHDTDDCFTYDAIQHDFELLKAAAHKVIELHLSGSSVKLLLTKVEPEEIPDFPRLSRLKLCESKFAWEHVISLLDKSLQLEILVFEWGLDHRYRDTQLPSNQALPSFSCQARVIEVHSFLGSSIHCYV